MFIWTRFIRRGFVLSCLFPVPSLPVLSRPLTEDEIADLQERHYDSIAEKQKDVDRKIQRQVSGLPRPTGETHLVNPVGGWAHLCVANSPNLCLHKYRKKLFKEENVFQLTIINLISSHVMSHDDCTVLFKYSSQFPSRRAEQEQMLFWVSSHV